MANSAVVPVVGMSRRRLLDQELNTAACVRIINSQCRSVLSVLDVRYGLGKTARRLEETNFRRKVYGVEIDEGTYRAAYHPQGGLALQAFGEGFRWPKNWPNRFDLVLADFSNVTKHNRSQLDEVVSLVQTRYLLFSDVACLRLHLHYRTYGFKQRCTLQEYWASFSVPGYSLLYWQSSHRRCSYGLYQRNRKPHRN